MPGYLAYIIPIDAGARPEHPIAPGGEGEPPGIWPSPGYPAHPIAPGGRPPGFWGPNDPRPTPPIFLPPYEPGGPPVGIWPSPGHPEHPIVMPQPPAPPTENKPPPDDGGWGYSTQYGWGYFPMPTSGGKPQPVPPGGAPTPRR